MEFVLMIPLFSGRLVDMTCLMLLSQRQHAL